MNAERPKANRSNGKPGLASRLAATTLLTRVVDDKRNLDALCDNEHGIEAFLSLETKDRRLARAIVVAALRNRLRIDAVLNKVLERPPPKRARFLIHSLHVAVTQILFLDVPSRAAVDLAVSAIGSNPTSKRFSGLANAVLRRIEREKEEPEPVALQVSSTLPQWLATALRRDYGKAKLVRISESVSRPSKIDLSVKSDSQRWALRLGGSVLPTGGVRLETQAPVSELDGYEEGEWWVQDMAASLPAHLINCGPGADVLELCAAPGGKTAQLILRGYDVTALDASRPRMKRLESNLDRLGMHAKLVLADMLEWNPGKQYSAVLLDAPCSSTGTIRRHPDVMWTKSAEEVAAVAKLQYRMIGKALEFVRPGGILVFSNCSMLKEEGEDLCAELLESRPDIGLVPVCADEVFGMTGLINRQGTVRSLPFQPEEPVPVAGGMDGFFAARFLKSG